MKTNIVNRTAILTLGLVAWLALPQCGHCFYNPSTGRWLNRDPAGEEGGPNLYTAVSNRPSDVIDALGKIGYGWECLLCGPKCQDPCGEAKAKGIDRGHIGGNVCCGGRVFACIWISGGISKSTQEKATKIIDACSLLHEKQHAKEGSCAGCGLYRPTVALWNVLQGECEAYYAQMHCLRRNRSQCNGDPVCEKQVDAERLEVSKRVVKFCAAANK